MQRSGGGGGTAQRGRGGRGGRSGGGRGRGGGGRSRSGNGGGKGGGNDAWYEEWYSAEAVQDGMDAGRIFVGPLRINAKKRNEAYVNVPQLKLDVFVEGDRARNRALNGDVVAVELLERDQWRERQGVDGVDEVSRALEAVQLTDDVGLWKPLVEANSSAARASEPAGGSDTAAADGLETEGLQPAGKVVAVVAVSEETGISIERQPFHSHIGVLVPQYGFDRDRGTKLEAGKALPGSDRFVEFRPLDNRVPFMLVAREDAPHDFTSDPLSFAPPNQRLFEAVMTSWPAAHRFPKGKLRRQVGEAGEIGPETDALLIENNCDHGEFPEAALDVLRARIPQEGSWSIPEEEVRARRDLRTSRRIFTVDPATAKDLDDALHCVPVPAGTVKGQNGAMLPAHFEIGVHIADVSYFVEPGTALDEEAQRRATTVYLVNKVLPMLPALLSEELCSLNEGVDRCAYSCIWRMTAEGDMLDNAPPPWFGRTVICSCARLDYGLAQRMVDGVVTAESVDLGGGDSGPDESWPDRRAPKAPHTKQEVIDDVRNLVSIAMHRRKKRFDREKGGALAMKQTKMSFRLDKDGNPETVTGYPIRNTNKTIEEYMLMANFLVAQQLILSAGPLAFIRNHPPPEPKSMTSLFKLLEQQGIELDPTALASAAGLHAALEQLERTQPALVLEVIYALMRKPMRPATYSPAGVLKQREWRHWALNIPYYTHFTSPIRRYADIVVHRQLTAVLDNALDDYPLEEKALERIAEHCNEKKEASKAAQDASDKLFLAVLIKRRFEQGNPVRTTAVVRDLGPQSFTVLLLEFGLEVRVHAEKDFGGSKVIATFLETDTGAKQDAANAAGRGTVDRDADAKGRQRQQRHGGRGGDSGGNDKRQVMSLSMTLRSVLPGSDPEQVTLEILSTMTVQLEPTIVNGARIDFKVRFVATTAKPL